jgi:hypothetical protein
VLLAGLFVEVLAWAFADRSEHLFGDAAGAVGDRVRGSGESEHRVPHRASLKRDPQNPSRCTREFGDAVAGG